MNAWHLLGESKIRSLEHTQPAPLALGVLIGATIVFGLTFLPAAIVGVVAFLASMMSPTGPEAEEARQAWNLVRLVGPYLVLGPPGLLLAWIFYVVKAYRTAIAFSLLLVLGVAAFILLLLTG